MNHVASGEPAVGGRAFIAMSGCSIAFLGLLATGLGACVLYLHRTGSGGVTADGSPTQPESEIDAIRLELLEVSGALSDPDRSDHDLNRARNQLEALEVRLDAQREDPSYLKVRALLESVQLQLDMSSGGEVREKVPPLPPSSIAPDPDESMVGEPLNKAQLVKNKIFKPSDELDLRYGPGRFYMKSGPRKMSSIAGLNASEGWTFYVVEVGIRGSVDLVEFSLRLLDDYHRAFPPHLIAEKGIEDEPGGRKAWRSVHEVNSRKKVVWLNRVYMMPTDATTKPILEIQRQGAAKKIWIQL